MCPNALSSVERVQIVILTIPPELEARIQQRAHIAGLSAEKWLRRIVEQEIDSPQGTSGAEQPVKKRDSRPIWDVIANNMKKVPPEDLAALPIDGASQIDHYIYGVPKRDR
jgi:hypothetical protein